MFGDATEIFNLERAGIERADVVAAVTGDDEDNIIICQVADHKFKVPKSIARVNNPENQEAFDVLGVGPTVSATNSLLSLIEHEMPAHKLVHLLNLKKENLEIVEVMVEEGSPLALKRIEEISLFSGGAADLDPERQQGADSPGIHRTAGRRPDSGHPRTRRGGGAHAAVSGRLRAAVWTSVTSYTGGSVVNVDRRKGMLIHEAGGAEGVGGNSPAPPEKANGPERTNRREGKYRR